MSIGHTDHSAAFHRDVAGIRQAISAADPTTSGQYSVETGGIGQRPIPGQGTDDAAFFTEPNPTTPRRLPARTIGRIGV